ncbi:MAG: trypsin-like peptidase domain-containing protein [Blastocatellia bacterium]|nr:trypsin-like peptidase domain-containing protein [Blastocatellia bacterium]
MVSLMFVSLSGAERGKTYIFDKEAVVVGTDSSCDLRIGSDLDEEDIVVAEILRRPTGFELTHHDHAFTISINNNQLTKLPSGDTVELQDGDLIGFRRSNSKETRYSLHVIEDKSLVPDAPQNLQMHLFPEVDTVGHIHPLTATRFLKGLATSLWSEIPRRFKMLTLFIAGFLLVGFAFSLVYILYEISKQWDSINDLNIEKERYEQKIEKLRAENEKLREGWKREIERINSAQNITEAYKGGVCLIQGLYTFINPATGAKLRYLDNSFNNSPMIDNRGQLNVSFDGTGAVFYETFSGTGFVIEEGKVLTNRHVVQPWWQDELDRIIINQGGKAELIELYAFFPGTKTQFNLKVEKLSSQYDLAYCSFNQDSDVAIPVLPIDPTSQAAAVGQRIVVLGYSTGIEGLIQRLDDKIKAQIMRKAFTPDEQVQEVARQGLLYPLTTQGHINGLNAGRIIHDAETSDGGSGSPIFNSDGKVIGINSAITVGPRGPVRGSNLGIPILFAIELINPDKHKAEAN